MGYIMERVWGSLAFTRARCLQNERALFDHLVKDTGVQWRAHDTPVSDSDPDDVVHSVVFEPAGTGRSGGRSEDWQQRGEQASTTSSGRVDLVLMHGFGNGGGCFWRNVASFGAMGRTHLVDWRGAGMSGRPRSFPPRTYEECVEYFVDGLEAWRRERLGETTKMCLVGHSMGAMIATYYARRHPDRVSHLILTGPASMKDDSDPAKLADFLQGSLLRRFMFNVASLAWRLGFTPQDFARWLPGNTALRFGAGYSLRRWRAGDVLDEEGTLKLARYVTGVVCMPGCSEKVMSVFLKPIGRANKSLASVIEHELDVAIPVTFVYGERDWMTPKSGEECTDDMLAGTRRNTKNVEFHLLPNAGHFAFIDQPTPFEDIVRSKWRRS